MTRGELAQIEVRFGTESGWLAMQQLPARERIEMFRADVMALLHAVQRLRDSERLRRLKTFQSVMDRPPLKGVSVEAILIKCAMEFDVPAIALVGPRNSHSTSRARHVAMYLCRRAGLSSPQVGRDFGRHHSTVLGGVRRVQERMAGDEAFAARVHQLETLLKDLAQEPTSSCNPEIGVGAHDDRG